MADSKILEDIKDQIKNEGKTPGTPEFEHRIDQVRVARCREYRNHHTCSECDYYDYCELIKRVLRNGRGFGETQ